ncbi:MmcQ/YjbR family DNA-binding protein [Actinosynnema sp. NPDC020468]|uniref:MmcQ/YjbR family DNA-binding protein n=1 Tax=Actinosynnema sp. NPDC020468 TaxID=3154488 RepID=UPI0033CE1A58
MTLDDVIAYCLAKPGAEETYPWGEGELVAKVGGKAFAFIGIGSPSVGLKCGVDAEAALPWRERYPDAIEVSAYIGRYGWNRVDLGADVADDDVVEMIDLSYDAVVAKLPKAKRP